MRDTLNLTMCAQSKNNTNKFTFFFYKHPTGDSRNFFFDFLFRCWRGGWGVQEPREQTKGAISVKISKKIIWKIYSEKEVFTLNTGKQHKYNPTVPSYLPGCPGHLQIPLTNCLLSDRWRPSQDVHHQDHSFLERRSNKLDAPICIRHMKSLQIGVRTNSSDWCQLCLKELNPCDP